MSAHTSDFIERDATVQCVSDSIPIAICVADGMNASDEELERLCETILANFGKSEGPKPAQTTL